MTTSAVYPGVVTRLQAKFQENESTGVKRSNSRASEDDNNRVKRRCTSLFREITEIMEVLKYRQEETVFIFDVDKVLINMKGAGGDTWFRWLIKWGKEKEIPFIKLLNMYAALQLLKENTEPVEETTAEAVKTLQEEGYDTYAVTSRGRRLMERTGEQLKEAAGIDFKNENAQKQEFYHIEGYGGKGHTAFEYGRFHTAGHSKGEGLKVLFKELDLKPKKVVFIDDSEGHIKDVAEACNQLGIDYVGLHYTRLKDEEKNFDPVKAEIFMNNMLTLLKNEDAGWDICTGCKEPIKNTAKKCCTYTLQALGHIYDEHHLEGKKIPEGMTVIESPWGCAVVKAGDVVMDGLTSKSAVIDHIDDNDRTVGIWLKDNSYLGGGRHPWEVTARSNIPYLGSHEIE